jgi:hypothetical protein
MYIFVYTAFYSTSTQSSPAHAYSPHMKWEVDVSWLSIKPIPIDVSTAATPTPRRAAHLGKVTYVTYMQDLSIAFKNWYRL